MGEEYVQFRLDPANACVWRGSELVSLTPKAFAVLRYLIEHPRRLVTKQELLAAVWPSTFVGDAVLKVSILEIRKALQDRHRAPRFIQTVHRGGYRFLGGIDNGPPPDDQDGARARLPAAMPIAILPPVGRSSVLVRLEEMLATAAAGERQVAFVTGEAGIGKSTVVEALAARLQDVGGPWIAHGQCLEQYGRGEAYLPVLEALSRLCGSHPHVVEVLRGRAPTWLAQMPWLVASADRPALLREVVGLTQERMLREMAETLEVVTAATPLVLVLEDLHWSDFSTLDLLAALARRREPARLLVIGTFRPSDVPAGENSVQTLKQELQLHRQCEELPLPFLGEAEVAEYLALRFAPESLPQGLAPVVHRRTDGNPLFMSNLLDYLIAQGAITQRADGLQLCSDTETVASAVPDSLRAMIEKRVERLPTEDQRLLEVASVGGVEFSAAAVAAGFDSDAAATEERCEQLARRGQFLRAAGVAEMPDGSLAARYAFLHALYQNVLYDRLTPARRMRLHQRIGEAEERTHGDAADEIGAELAVHFAAARDYVRAVHYLRAAAQRHVKHQANREAIAYLSRALELAAHMPPIERPLFRMALVEQLGLVRRSMGDMHGAARDFQLVADLACQRGQLDQEAKALLYLASALTWIDRDSRSAALSRALELTEQIDDELLRAHARGYSAYWSLPLLGWRAEDHAACAAAVAAARAAGDRELLSLHVGRLAYFQCLRSDYRLARTTAEEGLQLAVETGNAFEYMACQHYRALALLHLGEWGTMLATLRDGIAAAERNGHHLWATFFRLQIAGLYLQGSASGRALELCDGGLAESTKAAHRDGQVFSIMLRALAHLGLGDRARAAADLQTLEERSQAEEHLVGWLSQMYFHHALAGHWLSEGDLTRARAEALLVCSLAEQPNECTYLALGLATLASIALKAGRLREAEHEIARAQSVLEGREAPLAEWQVLAIAATVHTRAGRATEAAASRRRSAQIVQRLAASLGEADADLRQSFLASEPARRVLARARSVRSHPANRPTDGA